MAAAGLACDDAGHNPIEQEEQNAMSTTEADAKPSAEEAAGASSSAAATASGGSSPHKLPLIITGTEEHGPFVPPKPEDIHDVKPALKKHPHIGVDTDVMMADDAGADGDDEGGAGEDADAIDENGGSNRKKKAKKALKWDEHAIEEHDLLRGTRMKVGRYPKLCAIPFSIPCVVLVLCRHQSESKNSLYMLLELTPHFDPTCAD